jgi:hypothetical protein
MGFTFKVDDHFTEVSTAQKNGYNVATTMDMGILVLLVAVSIVMVSTTYVLMTANDITIDLAKMRQASVARRARARRRKERQAGIFTDHLI